jgi:hypothetical protein
MGAEISFMVGGKEVSSDKFGDALKTEAVKNIKEQVAERLRGIKCPEHGGTPQVTAEGGSLGNLEWKILGCCEKLRDEAQKALNRK